MEEYVDFSEPRVPNTAYDVPRTDERIECVNASLPGCEGKRHPHWVYGKWINTDTIYKRWVANDPQIDPASDDGGYGPDSYFNHAMTKDD